MCRFAQRPCNATLRSLDSRAGGAGAKARVISNAMPKSYTTTSSGSPGRAHAHAPAAQYARNAHAPPRRLSVRPALRTNRCARKGKAPRACGRIPTAQETRPLQAKRSSPQAVRRFARTACAVVSRFTQIAERAETRERRRHVAAASWLAAAGKTFSACAQTLPTRHCSVVAPHVRRGHADVDAHAMTAVARASRATRAAISTRSPARLTRSSPAPGRKDDTRRCCAESAPLAGDRVFLAQAAACAPA